MWVVVAAAASQRRVKVGNIQVVTPVIVVNRTVQDVNLNLKLFYFI